MNRTFFIALCLNAFLLSCSRGPASRASASPLPTLDVDQRLDVADVIEVRVYDEAQLSGEYRVSAEGTVLMPLIGPIKVGGLGPLQAGKLLADELKRQKMLRDPQVTVYVRQAASKKIRVLGQVGKPGIYPYSENMDIIEAITTAGGFTQFADMNDITVTRVADGKTSSFKVRGKAISEGTERAFFVLPGDTISVPERIF